MRLKRCIFRRFAAVCSAPLGISFFTFHGISYLVDVYREPSRVCRRADTLFLYLAFFPA